MVRMPTPSLRWARLHIELQQARKVDIDLPPVVQAETQSVAASRMPHARPVVETRKRSRHRRGARSVPVILSAPVPAMSRSVAVVPPETFETTRLPVDKPV